MGPLEVWVGWTAFFTLLALSAALGISGRLRLGEAATAGLLAIAAGLGTGGLVDALRNEWLSPLRYAIPMLVLAAGGYSLLGAAVHRKRALVEIRERPRPIALGYAIIAATAVTTVIAVTAAKAIAGSGAPIWVAPSLTGVATFAIGSYLVDRKRRRARARLGVPSAPPAVKSRTAIAVVLGGFTAFFYLSMSILALMTLVALPFTIAFMWSAARRASASGRLLISFVAALDLWPVGGLLLVGAARDRSEVVIGGGGAIAILLATVFWVTARKRSERAQALS